LPKLIYVKALIWKVNCIQQKSTFLPFICFPFAVS
jgi:hypothetical protein